MKQRIFVDIKTDKKYEINKFKLLGVPLVENIKIDSICIRGFWPYIWIDHEVFGKKTVEEILQKDKFISKTWSEILNSYLFNDTQRIEQTLAIIKPDGIKNATKIIDMIYESGLKIEKYEVRMLNEEILREHYSHLVDKPFYPELENYMLSSEVILMVLEGENAVEKLRKLMGPTDSTKAEKGTIRGNFGTDIRYNAIHGSDSETSAIQEINRFFKQKQKRI